MDRITKSPGLWHILENILENLDPKSLKNAQLVCQTWNELSKPVKPKILRRYFTEFKNQKQLEWPNFLDDFGQNRSDEEIEKLIKILDKFSIPNLHGVEYLIHIQNIIIRSLKI